MMFKEKSQKGQSLVEVAVAMPILILIVAGILDLGRAYFTYIALSDAAAEGAAYAAIHPNDTTQILERAADGSGGLVVLDQDEESQPGTVSVDYDSLAAGSPITVTIEYEYQILTPIIESFVPDGKIIMKAVAVQSIIGN
jgi:Flp pilus assembly protein TadG